jgi:tetratricopeptide (TPR) repeat protein
MDSKRTNSEFLSKMDFSDSKGIKEMVNSSERIDPDPLTTIYWKGLRYLINSDYKNAELMIQKASQIDPSAHLTIELTGDYKRLKGDFNIALELYYSILGSKDDFIVYNNIALCYKGLKDFNKALENVNKSLALDECYPNAYVTKLGICLKMRLFDELLEASNKLHQILPNDSYCLYTRGIALLSFGKVKECYESFNEALRLNPDFKKAAKARESLIASMRSLARKDTPK